MYIGIEFGGTKINIGYGTSPNNFSEITRIDTKLPVETLKEVIAKCQEIAKNIPHLNGIGIASFGPIAINENDADYGKILATPKSGWSYTDILTPIKSAFPNIPIALDTDVNAAAKSELIWGAAQGHQNVAYVTIGTGIGVGLIFDGKTLKGFPHPEGGHIRIIRHPNDNYKGICSFHGDCLEGMVCGPSIIGRYGISASNFEANHEIWDFLGYYMGQLCNNLILITSVDKIIIGGGVGLNHNLLPKIKQHTFDLQSGYLQNYKTHDAIDNLITHPALGNNAGVLGAISLFQ